MTQGGQIRRRNLAGQTRQGAHRRMSTVAGPSNPPRRRSAPTVRSRIRHCRSDRWRNNGSSSAIPESTAAGPMSRSTGCMDRSVARPSPMPPGMKTDNFAKVLLMAQSDLNRFFRADSACRSAENEAWLEAQGIGRLHPSSQSFRGRPMPKRTRRGDAAKSAVRTKVDHSLFRPTESPHEDNDTRRRAGTRTGDDHAPPRSSTI